MKRKIFSIIPLLLCGTLHAEPVTDEYGLMINAENSISLFPAEKSVAPVKNASLGVKRAFASTPTNKWYINHPETNRVCLEWLYDGQFPRAFIKIQKSNKTDSNVKTLARGRRCIGWVNLPKERYGTAAIYQGNDNVLNKVVVIVQPYIVSLDNATYSDTQFYNDVNQGLFANSLRNSGYDVILYRYLNTDSGVAFNAKGVKVLLNKLENLPSVTSTSVIGLSMGGVVARYALTELENEIGLHKMASYVSFDAPHLGANLPRGITDNISRLLSKIDTTLCGLKSNCRSARTILKSILSKINTKTYNELIINSPNGYTDRRVLLNKLASLGHVDSIPSLAITNGAQHAMQGYPNKTLVTHYKLHRKWYNGGSKYFKVYTNPTLDNRSGGYADFYQILSNLIAQHPHPITPYVTLGQKHSFVSTWSALAGNEGNFTEVASYPTTNERHLTITYNKSLKLRQWLDAHHF